MSIEFVAVYQRFQSGRGVCATETTVVTWFSPLIKKSTTTHFYIYNILNVNIHLCHILILV